MLAVVASEGAQTLTPIAMLIELMDRVRHDREFSAAFRREPIRTASDMDISLTDAEWAGIRHFLTD